MTVTQRRKEFAVVDTTVEGYQSLIQAADDRGMEVITISGDGGWQELGESLEEHQNITALHLLSHGSQGRIHLGDGMLSSDTLSDHTQTLELIRGSLSEEGDLLVYGCDVGAGQPGQQFVEQLALLTGADVAASDDLTGHSASGGDWDLESEIGFIDSTQGLKPTTFFSVLAPSGAQTYLPGQFNGIGTETVSNNYFDITGTAGGISQTLSNYGGTYLAFENRSPNYDGAVGTLTISINNSAVDSFTLTDLKVSEYSDSLYSWDSMSVTGQLYGGGTVSASITDQPGNEEHFVDLSSFTGSSITEFTLAFDSSSGGQNNPIAFALDEFTISFDAGNTAPEFGPAPVNLSIAETSTDTTSVIHDVDASDGDGGGTDSVSYSITAGNGAGAFAIDSDDGEIRLANPAALNYETTPSYTLTIQANDGEASNNSATQDIVIDVNDIAPAITTAATPFNTLAEDVANGTSVGTPALTAASDDDNVTWSIISGDNGNAFSINGTTGEITVNDTSQIDFETASSFALGIQASDGTTADTETVNINISNVNEAPAFTALDGTPNYTEGGSAVQLDADVALSDAELDATNFDGATLTITRNGGANAVDTFANTGLLGALTEGGTLYYAGGTFGTVTSNSGGTLVLTFNASASKAAVQSVMRSITYANTSDDPAASVQLDWTFNDGNTGAQGSGGAKTASGSTTASTTAVNDAPEVTPNGTQPSDNFSEGGSPVSLFDLDAISAVESAQNIDSFAFTVTGAVDGADDVLVLAGLDFPLNDTGGSVSGHTVSISGGTVTVTFGTPLSGPGAVSFIDGIQYKNTSENPTGGDRVFTLTDITDTGGTSGGGVETVNPNLARTVSVSSINDAPVINNLDGDTQAFAIGGSAVTLDTGAAVALTDVDNTTLASATVQITGNHTSAEDVLAFTNVGPTMGNVVGSFDSGTGTLTLTSAGATASTDEWAAALAAVTYANTNTDVDTLNSADRTVTVTVNDGTTDSTSADTMVSIVAAPVIDLDGDDSTGATNGGLNASFTEDSGAVSLVDADATLSDDGNNLNQLVITLTNAQTGDIINLAGRSSGDTVNGITITYDSDSQITLSGSATKADYLALMKEARFNNSSDTPDTTDRNITFVGRDTDGNTGSAVTATVSVTETDDQPVIGGTSAGQGVLDTGTIRPFSSAILAEADGESVTATVSLDNAAKGSFTALSGFTDNNDGSYTFTGSAAAAQSAFRGLVFNPTEDRVAPGQTETTTFTLSVEDDDGTTDPVTNTSTTVFSTSVNTRPTIGNVHNETSTVTAGAGAQALGLTNDALISDFDSADFNGGYLRITPNSGLDNQDWGVDGSAVTSGGDGAIAAGETVAVGGVAIGVVANDGQSGNDFQINFNANATPERVQTLTQNLTFSAPSNLGDRSFTLEVSDGDGTANGGESSVFNNFNITVQPNPPVIGGLDGGSVTYFEDGNAVRLDPNGDATVTDTDSANFDTGTITASIIAGGTTTEDTLTVLSSADDGLTVTGSDVFWDHDDDTGTAAVQIASLSGGSSGTPLTATLTAAATSEAAQSILRNLAYSNSNGDDPSTADRTISVTMTDSATDTATSATSTIMMGVTAVNDAPAISGGTISTTNTEGESSNIFTSGTVSGITDADAGDSFANARVVADIDSSGSNPYLAGDMLGIEDQGNVTYTVVDGTGEISHSGTRIADVSWDNDNGTMAIQFDNNASITGAMVTDVMNRIVFRTDNNDPTQGGTTPDRTINLTLEDGGNTGSGTPTWPTRTGTITITDVNDAPIIAVNNGPSVRTANTVILSDVNLNEGDPDDDGDQLTYTLDSLPSSGTLLLSGTPLDAGDTFTQQDINDGLVSFKAGSTTGDISFDVTLADGGEDGTGTVSDTVTVTVTPPPPPTPTPDPEPEPEPNTIDGAPATVTNSVDPDTGNPITTFEIQPVIDGNRVDEDSATSDVDVDLSDQVRASISENTGLIASRRSGGDRDNLRTVIDQQDDDNRPAAGEINDFLTAVNDEFDIVEMIPTRPTDSQGNNRINVRIDPPEGNDNGNDSAPVVIVDTRQLDSDTTQAVNINGAGSIVIRGSGTFRGDEELADDGAPDVDNVLGDNSAQTLFFGPGDDIIRGSGGDDVVGSAGGDDRLFGNSGDDALSGGAGADLLHGGRDTDVARYEGNRDDYLITQDHSVITVQARNDSSDSDTLVNVESLVFADGEEGITYDDDLAWITGLYDQVLGRQADVDGIQYWAQQHDEGLSKSEMARLFMTSSEAGQSLDVQSDGVDAVLDTLYQSLLGREADTGGKAYWADKLETGTSVNDVVGGFMEAEEMRTHDLDATQWEFIA